MVARLPKPEDFRRVYVAGGWSAVRARYGVGTPTITRWINEEGRDGLLADRAEEVARTLAALKGFHRQLSTADFAGDTLRRIKAGAAAKRIAA